jgi:hypothetical protein
MTRKHKSVPTRRDVTSLASELDRLEIRNAGVGRKTYGIKALLVSLYYPHRDYERMPKEWAGFPVACSLDMTDFPESEKQRNRDILSYARAAS